MDKIKLLTYRIIVLLAIILGIFGMTNTLPSESFFIAMVFVFMLIVVCLDNTRLWLQYSAKTEKTTLEIDTFLLWNMVAFSFGIFAQSLIHNYTLSFAVMSLTFIIYRKYFEDKGDNTVPSAQMVLLLAIGAIALL